MNGPASLQQSPLVLQKGSPMPTRCGDRKIGDQTLELQVHVGTILLELENRDVIPAIRAACEAGFRICPGIFRKGGS